MWALMRKDLLQLRSFLSGIAAAATLVLVIAAVVPRERLPQSIHFFLCPVLIAASGFKVPLLGFGVEERSNGLAFLRSLPIRPQAVVGAKYATTLIVVLGFAALLVAAGWLGGAPAGAAVSFFVFASSFVASLTLFLCVRVGVAATTTAFIVAIQVPLLGGLAATMRGGRGLLFINRTVAALTRAAASPGAPAYALLLGLTMMLASFVASAGVFARRDTSRVR